MIGDWMIRIPAFFLRVIPFGVMVLFFVFGAISLAYEVQSTDLMEEALSAIAAGKKDLSIRKDLNSNQRMNRFDRWIELPLTAPMKTRKDAHRLFQGAQNPVLWLREMGSLGEIKDLLSLPNGNLFHLGMTDGLPEEMRLCVETLLGAMAAANRKLGEVLQVLDQSQHSRLMAYLFESNLFDPENGDTGSLPIGREVNELVHHADRLDRKSVLEAGLMVTKAMHDVKMRLLAYMEKGHPIKTQVLTTALGRVEIGGPGPDEHDADAVLVIDVGGDDVYRGETAFGRNSACSIVLDLDGDDMYLGENGAQGSGIRGIGILWDVAGNDFYRAGNFAQGTGIFGMGLLVDEGGRDHYLGGAFVQAAAAWGFGGLLDMAGEDLYECRNSGQAFAGVKGTAVLCDLSGNDKYLSGVATPDHRDPTMNQSFSQGFAIGMRNLSGGGYALLADQWGNDHYECQYFGQGAGYYMGLGILYDRDGKDTYAARRYAQGAGIHYAFGLLMDEGGDDRYLSWASPRDVDTIMASAFCLMEREMIPMRRTGFPWARPTPTERASSSTMRGMTAMVLKRICRWVNCPRGEDRAGSVYLWMQAVRIPIRGMGLIIRSGDKTVSRWESTRTRGELAVSGFSVPMKNHRKTLRWIGKEKGR